MVVVTKMAAGVIGYVGGGVEVTNNQKNELCNAKERERERIL